MSIDKASGVVTEMQQNAKIIDDLMGGTKAMRAAREIYLPCWPLEDEKTYSARLAVSTLFPALRETVGQMTGRVFAERLNEAEIDKAGKEIAKFGGRRPRVVEAAVGPDLEPTHVVIVDKR